MALLYAKASDGYLASIPVNVMGFTQSLSSNGWQKLPSGLIIQWGAISYTSVNFEGNKTISFPIIFDVTYISVVGILTQNANNDADVWLNLVSNTTSSAIFYMQRNEDNGYNTGLQWFAIG